MHRASAWRLYSTTQPLAPVNMSKNRSESIARGLHLEVGHAQRRNDAVTAALGRTQRYEDDLVLAVVDAFSQLRFQAGLLGGGVGEPESSS